MAMINGGELIVRMLEQVGIKQLFVLHGGHLDAILQAARDHEFRWTSAPTILSSSIRDWRIAGSRSRGWAGEASRLGSPDEWFRHDGEPRVRSISYCGNRG